MIVQRHDEVTHEQEVVVGVDSRDRRWRGEGEYEGREGLYHKQHSAQRVCDCVGSRQSQTRIAEECQECHQTLLKPQRVCVCVNTRGCLDVPERAKSAQSATKTN